MCSKRPKRKKRYDGQFKISPAKAVLSNEVTVRELSEELAIGTVNSFAQIQPAVSMTAP